MCIYIYIYMCMYIYIYRHIPHGAAAQRRAGGGLGAQRPGPSERDKWGQH